MNENINLVELLKGHEGEIFYNPLLGYIEYEYNSASDELMYFKYRNSTVAIPSNGQDSDGNMSLFPSKEERDWNVWKKLAPPRYKTWSDLTPTKERSIYLSCEVDSIWDNKTKSYYYVDRTGSNTKVEKAALALMKIIKLIDVGYGGNVTDDEWKDEDTWCACIRISLYYGEENEPDFSVVDISSYDLKTPFAFHTVEQAEEFLSYPENVQLLRDYFMLN